MKFKARKSASELTRTIDIANGVLDDWKIEVRYLSPARERELNDRATLNGKLDVDRQRRLYAEDLFVGWKGLTLPMLESFIEFDGEEPALAGDGTVPYSPDLAEFLIAEGRVFHPPYGTRHFEAIILETARTVLHLVALEKKRGSAGNSEN